MLKTNVVVRNMLVEDVATVYSIGHSDPGFQVADDNKSHFWSLEQLESWVRSNTDVLLVAESGDGLVVGFILTTLHYPTGKVTWENQCILPEYQNRGVGTLLVDEMIVQLKERGATYLHFLVESNNPSLGFYEKKFQSGKLFRWFGEFL